MKRRIRRREENGGSGRFQVKLSCHLRSSTSSSSGSKGKSGMKSRLKNTHKSGSVMWTGPAH